MKKDLSNSEQWSRRIGYALTLLVLLDCIVPFTWNAWNGRPGRGPARIRSRERSLAISAVDTLAKVANRKSLWPNNEFGLENGFEEEGIWKTFGFKSGSNKVDGVQVPDEVFRRNLTVFILPDLRRTTAVNENGAAVASNQELSLQDSDAIDFYWRQDIDAEKGLYPNLWSPDLQYERDVQLVTEKTLLQPGYTDPFRHIPDQTEFLREFIQSQKDQFAAFDALPSSSAAAVEVDKARNWQSDGKSFVFEPATTQLQETGGANGYSDALDQLDLDWLNSSAAVVDPMMNAGFLDTSNVQSGGYNVDQGATGSEYNFLNIANNDLNTPPVSMEWESRPEMPVVNTNGLEESREDPLFNGLFSSNGFDSLPTPDLMLAPNDVACIFGDQQVLQDVVDAQTTKDMMLHHSPVVAVETMPSTSATELVSFAPMAFGDDAAEQEQSEVFIETLPPYGDPYDVTSWPQTAPSVPSWQPQPAVSTTGASSSSPTWSGDHDYTLEASGENTQPNEWSYGDEVTVKSEVDYDDDDDGEEDEDSSEQRARAASERDEARARQLNLPFTAAEIVTMSQQEYIALTRSKGRCTREQLELIKEIRRHGGNKEAARRSRQKKVQMSKKLEDEVSDMERERNALMAEHRRLLKEIDMEERVIEQMKRKNMRQ